MRLKLSIAICLCWLASIPMAQAQQKYQLIVPDDPSVKSTATRNENQLIIVSNGKSFTYERHRSMDSEDGKYAAYYDATRRRYVRFPVSGSGLMMLGQISGLDVAWTESQMQVVNENSARRTPPVDGSADYRPEKLHLADGSILVAMIDQNGKLVVFSGKQDRWAPYPQPFPLSPQHKLVPGGAVGLYPGRSGEPVVLTVEQSGLLIQLEPGKPSTELSRKDHPALVSGSPVATAAKYGSCMIVDQVGRIWQYQISTKSFDLIESRQGLVRPGANLAYLENEVFVIDVAGNLVGFEKNRSGWSNPKLIESGFPSGGFVSTWRSGGLVSSRKYLCAIGNDQQLYLFARNRDRWMANPVSGIRGIPGNRVGLGMRDDELVISCVNPQGHWVSISHSLRRTGGKATPQTIAENFHRHSPVMLGHDGIQMFSVDPAGRMITASYRNNRWDRFVFDRRFRLAPSFRQREVVPNPPLKPVEIVLTNDHRQALTVWVHDRRDNSRKQDFHLKPGESKKIRIDRDSGAVAHEEFTSVGPFGGGVSEVLQVRIPPKVLYDVVVFEYKVTSQYFDRTKNKSNKPDSVQQAHVSVGVFPIAPGERMTDGSTVQLYRSARAQKNPGAAAHFESVPKSK